MWDDKIKKIGSYALSGINSIIKLLLYLAIFASFHDENHRQILLKFCKQNSESKNISIKSSNLCIFYCLHVLRIKWTGIGVWSIFVHVYQILASESVAGCKAVHSSYCILIGPQSCGLCPRRFYDGLLQTF